MAARIPALLILGLAALVFACGGLSGTSGSRPDRVEARAGNLIVRAELALTPQERALGLGGRESLGQGAGMLFVFPQAQEPGFWMRDMRFSLDFVWVSPGRRVVALTEGVPPPALGVSTNDLPLYRPPVPVLYVLEVNAGVVRAAGVVVGAEVSFQPDVSPEDAS